MNWRKILIGEWSWKRPFYTLGWVYFLLALFAYFGADSLIFQPPGTPYPEDRAGYASLQDGEERLAIFHLPPSPGMPTLLWSHGNAQNLQSLQPALEAMQLHGFGVISYDYPGYGESSGSPSEKSCYRAMQATYDHLTTELGCAPDDVVLIGQSVGSGPTCWLAAKEKHRAMVLISPFLSAFRTVTRVPLFLGDRFPNVRLIEEISTPLLIIHGEEDQVVPFAQGKRLFELSPSPDKAFLAVADAGHNDIFAKRSFNLAKVLFEFTAEEKLRAYQADQKTDGPIDEKAKATSGAS